MIQMMIPDNKETYGLQKEIKDKYIIELKNAEENSEKEVKIDALEYNVLYCNKEIEVNKKYKYKKVKEIEYNYDMNILTNQFKHI